jgi:uncharacterized repeat protein (TIGR01451 family)
MKKLLSAVVLSTALFISINTTTKADSGTGTTFSVTKNATPNPVSVSSDINFSISIKNISNANSAPTQVVDTLPSGFVYNNDAKLTNLSGTQSAFTPTISGQTLTWAFDGDTLQTIPSNQNIVISFSAKTPATAGSYSNQACLTQPENVCSTVNFTVQSGTPQAGIIQNTSIILGAGTLLTVGGIKLRKKKLTFEQTVLSNM